MAEARRSSDQATIEGYLTWFPGDREVISRLSAAAQAAAERLEWAWRRRSERWRIFDHEAGPTNAGGALADARAEDVAGLLSEIGIGRPAPPPVIPGARTLVGGAPELGPGSSGFGAGRNRFHSPSALARAFSPSISAIG